MNKKIEKLKEVNSQLNNVLTKLEAHIFINNIENTKEKKIREEKPIILAETKQ